MGTLKNKPDTGDGRVKYYYSKYVTYSRAIAVMWGVLVVCFLIIALVCLIQPTWFGAARDAAGAGHFGLWRYFVANKEIMQEYGTFLDFDPIPSASFKAATVFVGLTVLLTIICIICFLLFCWCAPRIVFFICGCMLAVDAIMMFLACVIYPGGWDAPVVQKVCGSSSYNAGKCYVQWAYILAIIGIFDAIVLAILAFVLAYRQVKLLPWQEDERIMKKTPSKAYIMGSDNGSGIHYIETVRRGEPQPVIYVDQRSERSQPIGTYRSHKSDKRNFHL